MPAIQTKKFAFIDVETTGFYADKHEIIELGCVVVMQQPDASWRVIHELDVKVKPERIEDADPGALRVNGYDPEQWLFAHSLKEAMEELASKAKDSVMIAHNIAFDYSFISKAFQVTGVESTLQYQKFDTISIAFAKLHKDPDVRNWSLRALCDYFGIVNEHAHNLNEFIFTGSGPKKIRIGK